MKKRRVEWGKILIEIVYMAVIPTLLFAVIAIWVPSFLKVMYHVLAAFIIIQATMAYVSALSSLPSRKSDISNEPEGGEKIPPVPKSTFIVSAYLPNEVDVIQATLENLLEKVERPDAGIEVILAYNSSHFVGDIEPKLRQMAVDYPELILANAHGSRSKAENLNYVLSLASGEMICLLDADHQVSSDCLKRAWRWIAGGADVVQGRCKSRNGGESLLSSLVDVEFETIYGVAHPAKYRLFNTALFGGSDGYWRADALRSIGFRPNMLTEDIDSTLRAQIAGLKFANDRSIVSTELSPTTLGDLWFQRKRWSQGWFQCTRSYQREVLRSDRISGAAKFMWTWLLGWRVTYDVFANFLFPVVFAYWISVREVRFPMTPFIWFAVSYTLLSGPFEALAAYKNAVKPRFPLRRLLLYSVFAFPYTLFKSVIHMVAIRDELLGRHEWVVTPHAAKHTDADKKETS